MHIYLVVTYPICHGYYICIQPTYTIFHSSTILLFLFGKASHVSQLLLTECCNQSWHQVFFIRRRRHSRARSSSQTSIWSEIPSYGGSAFPELLFTLFDWQDPIQNFGAAYLLASSSSSNAANQACRRHSIVTYILTTFILELLPRYYLYIGTISKAIVILIVIESYLSTLHH